MAKRDSNKVREEERTVETEAAYAGKGAIGEDAEGGTGDEAYRMPKCEKDRSVELAQKAADLAAEEGPLGGVEEGGIEVY